LFSASGVQNPAGRSQNLAGRRRPAAMYSIFYIIGVVVVILAVLALLGLA
jgi:hypothetical protein